MAIQKRLLGARARAGIFIAGAIPPNVERIFSNVGFIVKYGSSTALEDPDLLDKLAAVLFIQKASWPSKAKDLLAAYAGLLLDYDIRVFVLFLFSDDTSAAIVDGVRKHVEDCLEELHLPYKKDASLPEPPNIELLGPSLSWDEVANRISNFIAKNPAGIGPNRLLELPKSNNLEPDTALLLRRSFSDFRELRLERLRVGRSGASVYLAYASDGRWHQPFFIKIDTRDRIMREYNKYQEDVEKYVPYHLHPRLRTQMCCLGARKGILIGDFVDKSESLLACIKEGRAGSALANLFNQSLHGWYKDASLEDVCLVERLPIPDQISDSCVALAKNMGKAVKDYSEIRAIYDRLYVGPVLMGQIHGDLNAGNIQVRGFDAVLIDFYGCNTGPLLYDAACLEASLLVDGLCYNKKTRVEWQKSVWPIYVDNKQMELISNLPPDSRARWFYISVNEIRTYAHNWEHGSYQYHAVLAVALLKKASKEKDSKGEEKYRRAAAYFFAERILTRIAKNINQPNG
jgi:hypothetical protein